MKIGIGSDHGGFELKEYIRKALSDEGIEVVDYGTYSTESVDYPDFGKKTAEAVIKGEVERAIVICGTGIGISIAANKVKGVRCCCCSEPYSARMSRRHNKANALAMGGRVVGDELALMIVDEFLATDFEGGRHEKRVNLIGQLDEY